jgi:hypothetical protein
LKNNFNEEELVIWNPPLGCELRLAVSYVWVRHSQVVKGILAHNCLTKTALYVYSSSGMTSLKWSGIGRIRLKKLVNTCEPFDFFSDSFRSPRSDTSATAEEIAITKHTAKMVHRK